MTTDPVQALIDAGAIPTNPFGPDSRYVGVPFGLHQRGPTDPAIAYVLRRFIPRRRDIPIVLEHIVQGGERPDLLAAQLLGNPEVYWRICDANAVTDPFELSDTLGARIGIPGGTGL